MLTAVGLQQFDPFFTSTMLSIAITLYDNNKCLQLITRLRIQNSVSDLAVPPALLTATFPATHDATHLLPKPITFSVARSIRMTHS